MKPTALVATAITALANFANAAEPPAEPAQEVPEKRGDIFANCFIARLASPDYFIALGNVRLDGDASWNGEGGEYKVDLTYHIDQQTVGILATSKPGSEIPQPVISIKLHDDKYGDDFSDRHAPYQKLYMYWTSEQVEHMGGMPGNAELKENFLINPAKPTDNVGRFNLALLSRDVRECANKEEKDRAEDAKEYAAQVLAF